MSYFQYRVLTKSPPKKRFWKMVMFVPVNKISQKLKKAG